MAGGAPTGVDAFLGKAGAALTNDNKSSPLTALVALTLQFNNRLNCLMTR